MSQFSSALKLTDLDDFILPSQECILPVNQENRLPSDQTGPISDVKKNKTGGYVQIGEDGRETELQKATITLNDCLACSGCVTSAETVLIQSQSHQEFLRVLRTKGTLDGPKVVVVTIAPQARSSLATKFDMSDLEFHLKFSSLLQSKGVDYFLDSTYGRNMSLLESAKEFVSKVKNGEKLPVLTSSCPGFICYAEKSHGKLLIPHISRVKSPQQMMGSLVKEHLAKEVDCKPAEVYHVTIMPCFDKKLEASREEFYDDIYRTRDVDCVITPIEVEKIFEEESLDVKTFEPAAVSKFYNTIDLNTGSMESHTGGGSGGYADFVYKYAAKELYGQEIPTDVPVVFETLKNKDMQEALIKVGDEVKLRFIKAYGFRNIQTVVQKLKRKRCNYDFVEIMACPGGCNNGGGQCRPDEGVDSRAHLEKVEAKYYESKNCVEPRSRADISELYDTWMAEDERAKNHRLYTSYKIIEKTISGLNVKW
eukprot:Clim_evm6s40 gene=Clim_evmTU6s40